MVIVAQRVVVRIIGRVVVYAASTATVLQQGCIVVVL